MIYNAFLVPTANSFCDPADHDNKKDFNMIFELMKLPKLKELTLRIDGFYVYKKDRDEFSLGMDEDAGEFLTRKKSDNEKILGLSLEIIDLQEKI